MSKTATCANECFSIILVFHFVCNATNNIVFYRICFAEEFNEEHMLTNAHPVLRFRFNGKHGTAEFRWLSGSAFVTHRKGRLLAYFNEAFCGGRKVFLHAVV